MDDLFVTSKNIQGRKVISFKPWYGEFGWEVMSWIPFCRKLAADYDVVVASSYAEMRPLYDDFVTEYHINNSQARGLDYPKMYHVDGRHVKYGEASKAYYKCDVLIHARGIRRKANINYKSWAAVMEMLPDIRIGWIGSNTDKCIKDFGHDLRCFGIKALTDEIAAAKQVVGVSSGIMHLAAACGANLVCWGDDRTYFSETLEKRYKKTWNPHNVKVNWITVTDWQPQPQQILEQIEKGLEQ